MEFKEQLRIARDAKGWTQEQLGKKLGVSMQAVLYWERGDYTPRPAKLKKLEVVLGQRFDLTGAGFADNALLPPGVTSSHIEVALCLSRLPAPEREAMTALIRISASRVEGKPIKDFFETKKEAVVPTQPFSGSKTGNGVTPKQAVSKAGSKPSPTTSTSDRRIARKATR